MPGGGWVPGGEEKLFQWLCARGMNPPQPAVAGGMVGTASLAWLAAVLPLLQNPLLQRRGRVVSEAGRVEEPFQLPYALGVISLKPFLAGRLFGTAVRACCRLFSPCSNIPCLQPSDCLSSQVTA